MWVVLALAVLGFGVIASAIPAKSRAGGLGIGLATAGTAGALCVIGGWSALSDGTTGLVCVEWTLPLGHARLAVDGLSAWFLLVIGLVSISASIYSWGYFNGTSTHGSVGALAPLLCTLIGALVLVVCAADAVVFLVGWELMALSSFFLIGFHDEDADARRGAWTYLVASHLGTMLGVLPVFAAFVARSGGTSMDGFASAFGATEVKTCVVLFVFGVVGFGTKAGFMPFHVWLPAAHPVAPSPVSALMSGVVIKMGIYGLLRLLSWLPDLPVGCAIGLMTVSLVTGITGILYALGQHQIKRMLAYSSIENIGIIGLAISVGLIGRSLHQHVLVVFGLGGALLHVLNHALFKGLLFLSAGAVLHDTGTGDIERLGGLAQRTPLNALAFLVGSVAICALPPLNGFVSEFAIYTGILQGVVTLPSSYAAALATCAAALALIGGLALLVFSKTFSVVFLGTQRDRSVSVHSTPATINAGMILLALACVAAAVGSGAMIPAVSTALSPFAAAASENLESFGDSLGLVARVLPPLGVLIVVAIGLFAVRRRMTLGRSVGGAGATWGCGYAFPESTMQYTGSSYAWKMIHSFRHVIRPMRQAPDIVEYFPSPEHLVMISPDMAQEKIYKPLFTGLARVFERFWPLQHGRIQLYLVYIVATVLIVFVVEGWSARFPVLMNDDAARQATEASVYELQIESAVSGRSDHD